jgi:hypothetical protein
MFGLAQGDFSDIFGIVVKHWDRSMRVSSPRVCPNNLIHIYLATTRAVFSFTIPGRCHQYGQGTHTHQAWQW